MTQWLKWLFQLEKVDFVVGVDLLSDTASAAIVNSTTMYTNFIVTMIHILILFLTYDFVFLSFIKISKNKYIYFVFLFFFFVFENQTRIITNWNFIDWYERQKDRIKNYSLSTCVPLLPFARSLSMATTQ